MTTTTPTITPTTVTDANIVTDLTAANAAAAPANAINGRGSLASYYIYEILRSHCGKHFKQIEIIDRLAVEYDIDLNRQAVASYLALLCQEDLHVYRDASGWHYSPSMRYKVMPSGGQKYSTARRDKLLPLFIAQELEDNSNYMKRFSGEELCCRLDRWPAEIDTTADTARRVARTLAADSDYTNICYSDGKAWYVKRNWLAA